MKLTLSLFLTLILTTITMAATPDIHSMVIGDNALTLTDTRQLTFKEDGNVVNAAISPDGKWLAFVAEFEDVPASHTRELCIVKTSGGRPLVLESGVGSSWEPEAMNEDQTRDVWRLDGALDWSDDSKYVGIAAQKLTADMTGIASSQRYVLLYETRDCKPIEVPLTANVEGIFKVSPTGRQVAVVDDVTGGSSQIRPAASNLRIFATQSRKWKTVSSDDVFRIVRWSDRALALVCGVTDGAKRTLKKIWVDGSSEEVLSDDYHTGLSPDCKLRITYGDRFMVYNSASGKADAVVEGNGYHFLCWAPDSSLMLLAETDRVSDDTGKRYAHLDRLWLARPEKAPLNTLLIACGVDCDDLMPTWSANARKLAYASGGRAYVVEFDTQPLTIDQKIAIGAKLTEEEEKQVLVMNAKQIAVAVEIYSSDWGGVAPSFSNYEEDLKEYMKSTDLFRRPGSNTNVFKYLLEDGVKLSSLENRWETPLGELDSGYSWKVVVYADGHVKVVRK